VNKTVFERPSLSPHVIVTRSHLPPDDFEPAIDMIQVHRLFISPGHNFFGHHGLPVGENPIREMDQVDCVAGQGIREGGSRDGADSAEGPRSAGARRGAR
jgi:hypothetical protein